MTSGSNSTLVIAGKAGQEAGKSDGLYSLAKSQILTGGGGWPLNVFITPDKQPFYAATYLPREAREDMAGIIDILERIGSTWQSNRQQLLDTVWGYQFDGYNHTVNSHIN